MTVSVPGPIGTPPTRTTERSGWFSLLTSLYGTEMRTDVPHAAQAAQVQRMELLNVTDQPDDRAGYPPADERLAARAPHEFDDGVDVLRGGILGHHYDHGSLLSGPGRSPVPALGGGLADFTRQESRTAVRDTYRPSTTG